MANTNEETMSSAAIFDCNLVSAVTPACPRQVPDEILAVPIPRVIELSENTKLRFDQQPGQSQQSASGTLHGPAALPDDTGQAAEAESQMRKALGLLGESPRHRQDTDRTDQSGRGPDRFNGGLHRRRFVQDGDVPVTVLRREQGHEAPAHRSAAAALATPSNSRLQRTEAALAAETAARERAERALVEVQATARDLQTKIGHAELAKSEAVDALHREREVGAGLRAEIESLAAHVQETEVRADTAEQAASEHQASLADERQARKTLEKSLRAAEAARDSAQLLAKRLSDDAAASPRNDAPARRRAADETVVAIVRRGRPPAVAVMEPEPEPVKWWLNSKPAAKRR
jgi:hypothetical protein